MKSVSGSLAPSPYLAERDLRAVAAESRDLAAELAARVEGEVRFDGVTRMLYSTDASLYQIQPVGVVIPKHAGDVQAALEITARRGVDVLARGGGSSLNGQAVGAALVLDCSKCMDRVLAVDAEAGRATVQPGITVAVLNRTLAPLGWMLGPDPASADRATVGGCIGNNAAGSHSILYGMMADAVEQVAVLLADGAPARFGPLDAVALEAKLRQGGAEGDIYRRTVEIVRGALPHILERWPKHWRRTSGYTLDRLAAPLLPPDQRARLVAGTRFLPAHAGPQRIEHFNLAQLLAGSEGTLAVVTEATLRLVRRPARTGIAVIHFDNLLDACAAISDVLEVEPSASELLDRRLMDLARRQPEWARRMHFVAGDPAAVLLTEFYGAGEAELGAQMDRLEALLRARGRSGAIVRVLGAERVADVWAVRKAGLNLLMSMRGDFKPVPGIEDASVPPERLAEYLERVLAWCGARPDIPDVAVYAHASAGCLHVRPLVNVKTARGVETLQAMTEMAAALCLEFGGALSGEHGDGLSRSALNPLLFGPELYRAMQQVKAAFDPQGRLNPGKVVDAPPLTENLRTGPDYHTIALETVFDWGADGGFAPAIEMCNGSGVCRKQGAGAMCPSYMATRDEHDTTRGRANALRNALAGRIPHETLFSDELAGVLDLCLGCKACKSECPTSVDMAKIKAEYLVHYYRRNGLPLFNRLMGLLPQANEALYRFAPATVPLVNAALRSRAAHWAQARVGVAPERTLPAYAPQTFAAWFHARPAAQEGERPPVVLFHDTWTNFNEPEVGQAAVAFFEAAGYRVALAEGRTCCGRPLLTGGQADKARPWIDHNVALLAPFAAQGIPIVGIEPSCILTLRDEYPALAADRRRALLLAQGSFTLEEFIAREHAAGRLAGLRAEPGSAGKALLHGHCHQRALVGDAPTLLALRLAGYDAQAIPSGCCGMAGDFGYEAGHYAISRAIGEDRLLPAVREADPDTVIVASGTSCRHQIADFTGRRALHLAEALATAVTSVQFPVSSV